MSEKPYLFLEIFYDYVSGKFLVKFTDRGDESKNHKNIVGLHDACLMIREFSVEDNYDLDCFWANLKKIVGST
jgi:hypothetical protein